MKVQPPVNCNHFLSYGYRPTFLEDEGIILYPGSFWYDSFWGFVLVRLVQGFTLIILPSWNILFS